MKAVTMKRNLPMRESQGNILFTPHPNCVYCALVFSLPLSGSQLCVTGMYHISIIYYTSPQALIIIPPEAREGVGT